MWQKLWALLKRIDRMGGWDHKLIAKMQDELGASTGRADPLMRFIWINVSIGLTIIAFIKFMTWFTS